MGGAGRATAVALLGMTGVLVDIEAALTNQKPGIKLVGLPDAALREAQVRIRSAIEHSGFEMPKRHLTVNLSPAALPKHGSAFDLGIALAVLVTQGVVDAEAVGDAVHLGELGLDGRVRPVPGVLPAVLAARRDGRGTVVVAAGDADEARLVSGVRVVPVASLRDLAIALGAELDPVPVEPVPAPVSRRRVPVVPDLADVVGNREAVEALVVAAAGGHHLLMVGPPGAGKTMLAARLPGLLPDLDDGAALEATCVASIAGEGLPEGGLHRRPPWEAPHHTATAAALVGGGSGRIRPGAAARASGGVLFLDEAPEFSAAALEALRQPLESGEITIERATVTARYPGRFQLVLAANPCPCGQFGSVDGDCTCPASVRRRYLDRLSGPLLDRVDLRVRLDRVSAAQLRMTDEGGGPTTEEARGRVLAARQRTGARLAGTPWTTNAQVPGPWLRAPDRRLAPEVRAPLDAALERGLLSMRGYDRVLRVSWTLADLAGIDRPGRREVGAALTLRGTVR
ncbi:YifB family Mg chelatase-like AAA ATPase [Amnibacterium sp. CER49]|uniref:YifB family Mg chelatase-like AAA ATPase n=1 Tax=Amnibacterium sp. CER49 TaxID=3039161 RepID=UPI00244690F9|nr:YifB family Mg chelatase-like AAA ATPase [Amnibacterium sp. CER49]MDH2442732.1 YifB family Mg chelatase-like AAA ATPase [Amnibacterium sp. CER49]